MDLVLIGMSRSLNTFLYYIDDLRYFKHTLLVTIGITALIDSNLKRVDQHVMSEAIGQSQAFHIERIEDDHFVSKHFTHDRATY